MPEPVPTNKSPEDTKEDRGTAAAARSYAVFTAVEDADVVELVVETESLASKIEDPPLKTMP